MEEINRKLLKMEEMVLRSAFLHARCFPPGALLTPSGAPPPQMLQGWRIICFCLFIPWSLQWFLLAVVFYLLLCRRCICLLFLTASFCLLPSEEQTVSGWHPCWLRSAVLTQSGPGSSFSGRSSVQDLMVCPLHHDTAFPAHPLLSVLAMCSFSPNSPQSHLPDTSLSPPQTLSKTHQSWAPRPSSRPFLLTPVIHPDSNIHTHCSFGSGEWLLLPCLIGGHLPVYLFNWRAPTWHLRVSPGSPPLWSLSGLHHLPKLRQTGSFCFLCLPEEFYPRVPLASGLSSHGDAFRLALLPPFIWVILQEIPNLHYRFTSQGNQSWPVQPQGMGSASVLHYIGSNCERADSSTRI